MEYTVASLAKLSGVSTRTLRYYDEIGLLHPLTYTESGYRIYGQQQVDRLQQILFYREMDLPLVQIKKILDAKEFDTIKALEEHLCTLKKKKCQIEQLIRNAQNTIRSRKGEVMMNDLEKFEGFKQDLLRENEEKYGDEIRERYGEDVTQQANEKLAGMSVQEWNRQEMLEQEIARLLREAVPTGDPAGESAQKACDLHRQWLCLFWPEGTYTKAAHRFLGETYVMDDRFFAYYEQMTPGCAVFLRDALNIYCAQ